MPRDRIIVFDLETSRDRIIRPLMNELRTQASFARPTEVVTVDGRVKVAGEYPLEPGMRVSDLIRAGGGLGDAAYGGKAELTRYRVVNGDSRRTEQLQVDLAAVMRGEASADVELEPFDSLSIKEVPEWGAQDHVTLVGEVRFPGRYSIAPRRDVAIGHRARRRADRLRLPRRQRVHPRRAEGARAEAARHAREPFAERSRLRWRCRRCGQPGASRQRA